MPTRRSDRRDVLAAAGAGLVAADVPVLAIAQEVTDRAQGATPRFAYTGCRTTKERNARGKGIKVYRMDAASGAWSHVQLVEELVNPSFLAFDRTQRFLYAVHGDFGEVSAFAVDRHSGRLTFLNRQSTGGTNPVHLVADDGNKYLLVANSATGSLAVLPFRTDGSLDPVEHLVKLEGEGGPLTKEQSSSHPHEISYHPSRRFLLVPDKGSDRIFVFTFDPQTGALSPASRPFVNVAYELDWSLATYRWNSDVGSLEPVQVVPSTPDDFLGATRRPRSTSRTADVSSTCPTAVTTASASSRRPLLRAPHAGAVVPLWRQGTALCHRRSFGLVPLRGQREQRNRRDLPHRARDGKARADRSGRRDRLPDLHRLPDGLSADGPTGVFA